ncbi:hypothetical protein MW7_005950 [Imbroritus primus]|uniref:Uncharacterized protein n=1 Tax=Imbroritus primus TaxID=3058603 RepID=A0ACD3SQ35_9BURK|nr:hypothetical protein MW7_005950 [Burkholderiaceae bacterium PBA]
MAFAWQASRLASMHAATIVLRAGGIAAVALIGIALAPVWWWAIPGCFFSGVGFYMFHNALQLDASQMEPQRRGTAVALFARLHAGGQAAGVWIVGKMVEAVGTSASITLNVVMLF